MASWHSFDLRSGRRGTALTTQQQGVIKRLLCSSSDTQIAVSCYDEQSAMPRPDWDAATTEGRTMLVCLDDMERILWGGLVLTRVSGPDQWVQVTLVTLESYLDRRYVGDSEADSVDQVEVAAAVAAMAAADGIMFTVQASDGGTLIDYTTADADDKTVLAALTELSQLDGGIEFTVDLDWTDATHTALTKTLRISNRIGKSLDYPSRWTMPGCLTDFTLTEDYSSDNGANDVLAVSSGGGGERPMSDHQVATDLLASGWARFENRFSPSTTEDDTDVLNSYAASRLASTRDGGTEFSLVAKGSQAPVMNSDWFLGDDIVAALTCPRFPEQTNSDGARVAGYEHRVRVVGWEWDLDADTLTPTVREVV